MKRQLRQTSGGRNCSGAAMSSAQYPEFSPSRRSDRALRVLMVAGVAALLGTVAGGFSVFAIVTALNAPPSPDASTDSRHRIHAPPVDGPVVRAAPTT